MARRLRMSPMRSIRVLLCVVMIVAAVAWWLSGPGGGRPPFPGDSLEWTEVQRRDLETTLLVGGDLQPTKEVTVTCQVEDITDTEGMVIISVLPNGAPVKKGDEICRLDASELEEMARRQEIQVTQSRAAAEQARLTLETARIALREYEDGLVSQTTTEYQGKLALLRSDVQRQEDRVVWAEAMAGKGYLARSQLLSERQTLAQARHELARTEGELKLFRHFEVPRELQSLRGQVETAGINHKLESDRLKVELDRLSMIRKQVENCVVRAPQDGVVVYANGNRWRSRPLEPGVKVYQDQVMFILPDLSQMEVEISINESVGPKVKVGMKANVRLASMADRVLTGRVVSIDQLSIEKWREWDERLRHFMARVRLDKTPASALPWLSASVEIDTGGVKDALVIPAEALAVVDGKACCYILGPDGLERRPITTRRATTDLIEVIEGLEEGERVVMRSAEVDPKAVHETPEPSPRALAREDVPSPGQEDALERSTPDA
jgi:HlyD family secretion protein